MKHPAHLSPQNFHLKLKNNIVLADTPLSNITIRGILILLYTKYSLYISTSQNIKPSLELKQLRDLKLKCLAKKIVCQ